MNTESSEIKKSGRPSEESTSLAELIGPVPGLKKLPDVDSDEVVAATKKVLFKMRDQCMERGLKALAEVMARCAQEVDRYSLPPVIDNIRYQVGVVAIALATELQAPAASSTPSVQHEDQQ